MKGHLTFSRSLTICASSQWQSFFLAMNFFFSVLQLELRAFTLSHSASPFFVMGIFEIGSHELFVWAVFEPQSS
jgi:hypothetical protein